MGMVDEVIADARTRAGLTDLGPDSFHEGLDALGAKLHEAAEEMTLRSGGASPVSSPALG
mgnify:CR=1 FL=1